MVHMNSPISTAGAWNSMFRNNSTGISLRDAVAEKFDNSLDQFKRLGKKAEDCKIQFGFTIESPKIAYVFDNAGMQDGELDKFLCIFKPGKKEDEGNLIGQHGVGGQIADYKLSNQGIFILISKYNNLIQIYCVNFQKVNEAAEKGEDECMNYAIVEKFKSLDELFEFAKNDVHADPSARARICEVEEFSRKLFGEHENGTVSLYNDIQENGNNSITNLFKSLGSRSISSSAPSSDFDQKIDNNNFIGHTYSHYINNKSDKIKFNYIDSRGESKIVAMDPTYVSDLETNALKEDKASTFGNKFKPLSNINNLKVKVYPPFDKNNEGYIIEIPKKELMDLETKYKDRFDKKDENITYVQKRPRLIKSLPLYILYQKEIGREIIDGSALERECDFDKKKFNKEEPYYLDVTFTHTEELRSILGNGYNERTCGITVTRMGKSLDPYFPNLPNDEKGEDKAKDNRFSYGYVGKLRSNENTHFRMKISFNDAFCNRLFPSKINKSESGQSVAATRIVTLLFRAHRVLWPKKISKTSCEEPERNASPPLEPPPLPVEDLSEIPPLDPPPLADRSVHKGVVTAVHGGGDEYSVKDLATGAVHRLPGANVKPADLPRQASAGSPPKPKPKPPPPTVEDLSEIPPLVDAVLLPAPLVPGKVFSEASNEVPGEVTPITSNNLLQEPVVPNSRDLDTQNQNPVGSQKPTEEFKKKFIGLLNRAKPEWFKWMREELEQNSCRKK